ncbi:MAG: Wzz/FepE/Etk N-terminal domain-containing protein [Solirubrobacteraceae bacterium]|jgi:Mrp family chromosome partitioning ATPase
MNEITDAKAIFAPIWRRMWLILIVGILVAGGTYLYYKRKPEVFQAATQIYLAAGSEEQGVVEKASSAKSISASSNTQTAIINDIVVESVGRQLRKEHNRLAKQAARGKAKAKGAGQFIIVITEARTPKAAALLANEVAQAYIKRKHSQYERGVLQALTTARRQLSAIETSSVAPTKGKGASKGASPVSSLNVIRAATLSSKINQLESQLAVNDLQQIKRAKGGVLIGPQPKKNAEFGFVIAIILAAIAAFALSRFNPRLRSLADIEGVLQTQILTALPQVRRPIVHREGKLEPSRLLLEPLRRLHTTLRLANMLEQERRDPPRSILFLSADAGDGKSTLIADLALVQGAADERTAVIEADFRRPVQAKLLGVDGSPGLLEVLAGRVALGEAMQAVPLTEPKTVIERARSGAGATTTLASRSHGSVSVLLGGTAAVNPPALLASAAMTDIMRSVAEDFDQVLIDAPSPLEVSDVMPLLAAVDAIVIVARLGHTREKSAQRLVQLLMRTHTAPVLGVVANGVARKEIKKYGISPRGDRRGWPGKLIGR